MGTNIHRGTVLSSDARPTSPSGPFQYRSYAEMAAFLQELNTTYPDLVRVSVAQDTYKLPSPPELQCRGAGGGSEPCRQYVVHLTNHSTLESDPFRPEVFFSGALHGDERVGPTTTVELIALIASSATAYAEGSSSTSAPPLTTQRWLHELVNTRSVVLMPMTNAYGYDHETREELDVDPNRDYNYMVKGRECMKAMTSRVVNELWRDHVFQLAVTFHGGMRAVGFEWGSPNHYLQNGRKPRSEKSPDHTAQSQLANTLATYAGTFQDGTFYPFGAMNDVVYGVSGGMEDWAYAASWENQYTPANEAPFQPCEPTTYGGYSPEKTKYNNATHRAFNILVETANAKHPKPDTLGRYEDLYATELDFHSVRHATTFSAGHVTQNVRLALMLIDLVQPYVRWIHLPLAEAPTRRLASVSSFVGASLFVESDKKLQQLRCDQPTGKKVLMVTCATNPCPVRVTGETNKLRLQLAWEVLGAITVDATRVQIASSESFANQTILEQSVLQTGKTRRFYDILDSSAPSASASPGSGLFTACLDVALGGQQTLFVRARAKVDQDWQTQATEGGDVPSPRIPPQSHLVNARTNPRWNMESNGHRVKGELLWYSPVLRVLVEGPLTDAPVTTAPPTAQAETSNTPDVRISSEEGSASGSNTNDAAISFEPEAGVPDVHPPLNASTPVVQTTQPSGLPAAKKNASSSSSSSSRPVDETPTIKFPDNSSGDDEPPMPKPREPRTTRPPTDEEDEFDGEEEEDTDDVRVSDVPRATTRPTPPPTRRTTAPGVTIQTPSPTPTSQELEIVHKADGKSTTKNTSPSLLNYGYLVLGTGTLIVVLTVAFLYRRVFRANRRQPYMHLQQQQHQERRSGRHQRRGNRRGSPVRGDDDDENLYDDDDDPSLSLRCVLGLDFVALTTRCFCLLQMLRDGTFRDEEVRALATNRRLRAQYTAFRGCDGAFQEMLEAAEEANEHHHHHHHHQHQQPSQSEEEQRANTHEAKYIGYMHCVGTTLCPSALREWYSCLEAARDGKVPVEDCVPVKSMLERCLRAESDAMFRATQDHVFRSSP
ncbi:hypothetical protein P43SY_005300 [Pythium insidiosum]|uniref:Peptidase M14 domain-containing protein n=1 Tax=Pythium insidiosum TaxID=114742 RepID=A0AAD5Q6S2_PYTIN|nr:hypothetical protein P43SY_005300 [Pythium insidiosum]